MEKVTPPLLLQLIPAGVRLIDPAIGLAIKLDDLLGLPNIALNDPNLLEMTRFCVTSDPSGFADRAASWLGKEPEVELVSLRFKACSF